VQPLEAASPVEQLVADIKRFHAAARSGLEMEESGRARFLASTMDLASALLAGRELHQNDNNAFGAWLAANGLGSNFISDKDRWALLNMAAHREIATRVIAATKRNSWQHIWNYEIRPAVEGESVSQVRNTLSKPKPPNRGGRPPKTPTQSHSSPENIIERELLAKCSGEWLTADKMASRIRRAVDPTRGVLKTMDVKGLVEQRKAAGNVATESIEFRVDDNKPDAPPDVVALETLKRQADDLEFTLPEKNERIADLERLLEEAFAENDDLKRRVAQLEALSGVGPSALQPETVH
jgi:hypothetical protein